MNSTPRLSLPFISPGQAQKEFTHNESLQTLDIVVAGAVEEGPRNTPPAGTALGAAFLVGSAPTGAWSGKPQTVAAVTSGGWRFVQPVEGLAMHVKTDGTIATFRMGQWEIGVVRGSRFMIDGQQVVSSRQAAIPPPAAGVTVDAEARTAIVQILSAMRAHGLIDS